MDWVTVGDPGNPPDDEVMLADRTRGYGSVPYTYKISKYLVTNAQYAEFLNAKASESDLLLLYFPLMDRAQGYGIGSGIIRTGGPGSYHYAAEEGRERYPVNYVNMYMALRFANWMHNGKGDGDTETGAYTLLGGLPIPTNTLTLHRNPDAKITLANNNEWYKAAYYDGKKHVYYDYPAGTDEPMTCELPGPTPNTANCGLVTAAANPDSPQLPSAGNWFWASVTEVGAYTNSASPYGAYDMGGNLFQWTDEVSLAVTNSYHAGDYIAPVSDVINSVIGNPFQAHGLGPCGILRGTDFGDGPEFNHANGRTCDLAFFIWETYGIRLVKHD
jgi:formylglycine-generating enzyme required for sulfatase activity